MESDTTRALQDLWFHHVFTDWLDPVGWARFLERRSAVDRG